MPRWGSWPFRLYLGGLVLLAGVSALDPNGLRKARRLAAESERIETENARLAQQNARQAREVKSLKSDPNALERAAREDLGLVKRGERVYRVEVPEP